jgi:pseudouridine synthase
MNMIRLQKYIADQGITSRRKAEDLIRAGKISVNGKIAEIGQKVDPEHDEVEVRGRRLQVRNPEKIVYLFNKPKGVTSTTRKFPGERNILAYFPDTHRLFPAGRLDKDSRGLMILTNDGELANQIMHPSKKSEKEYLVTTYQKLDELALKRLKQGIKYEGVQYKTISVRELRPKQYRIVLGEGKKRHIRMMFRAIGYDIKDLFRKRINDLEIGNLPPGKHKILNEEEIVALLSR